MGKRIVWTVILLMLVGAVYWAWRAWRVDPQVKKVQEMQAALFAEGTPPEQRRANFAAFRTEMEKLTPQQREQIGRQMRQQFETRMDQRLGEYFAMGPAQRVAFLDQQINEMEQRRKDFEQFRAQAQAAQGANAAAGQTQGQNNANSQGRGDRPTRTAQERAQARKSRLDRSTPTQRAQRSAFFEDMQKRRAQLGLPPMTMRPPSGGGGGGGAVSGGNSSSGNRGSAGGGPRGGGLGFPGFGPGR